MLFPMGYDGYIGSLWDSVRRCYGGFGHLAFSGEDHQSHCMLRVLEAHAELESVAVVILSLTAKEEQFHD